LAAAFRSLFASKADRRARWIQSSSLLAEMFELFMFSHTERQNVHASVRVIVSRGDPFGGKL